jgi:hypothetical protein
LADSNVSHDVEARLRNIESHLGIGKVDEETGEYSVEQKDAPAEEEKGADDEAPDTNEEGE